MILEGPPVKHGTARRENVGPEEKPGDSGLLKTTTGTPKNHDFASEFLGSQRKTYKKNQSSGKAKTLDFQTLHFFLQVPTSQKARFLAEVERQKKHDF